MSHHDDSDRARRTAAADGVTNRTGPPPLEAGRPRVDRFVVRGQAGRFRVVDIWTGETAVIAMTAQDALSEDDAAHTAGLLNRRAAGGDRSLPQ